MNMKSADTKKNGEDGAPKRESMLYSLWRKVTANRQNEDGASEEPDVFKVEQPMQADELPFEKTAVPEALAQAYILWHQQHGRPFRETVLVEDICVQPYPEFDLLEKLLIQANDRVKIRLAQYEDLKKQNKELLEKYIAEHSGTPTSNGGSAQGNAQAAEIPLLEALPPVDGETLVYTSPDWLAAWCLVLPPLGTGKAVTEEHIRKMLQKKGIIFGVFDEHIAELMSEDGCLTVMPIAMGIPPVRGEDGRINEHFPHDIGKPHFIENAQGIVDFENLNWLVPIEKGAVVCEITPPTMGVEGKDVRGRAIRPYNGRKPALPMGENVVLSEDGTALQAKISGQISFRNEKFHITNTIVIPGNVDLSTGNLNVRGDLVVKGNVLAGFTVQASGNITIGGIVEGSQVTAGGSLIVNRGMNGNLVGTLSAGRDIHCKYMENASVFADGNISMDSIVNCDVSCNGKLIVRSGRGVIIGGTALAMRGIEAKIIGNKAGRITVLSIGPTMQFLRARELAEKDLENVEYKLRKARLSDADGKVALNQRILELKRNKLTQTLENMADTEKLISHSHIRADKLYPIVQVSISGVALSVLEPYDGCTIYLDSREDMIAVSPR